MNPFLIAKRLHQHRSLIWQFTKRNIDLKHKGSYLGVIWLVLNPLMQMAIYSFVFGVIFGGMREGSGYLYALGIFLSLTIYQLIAESFSQSCGLIASNTNFVKKVVFPLEILPVATMGSALYHFAICLALVFVGVLIVGDGFTWHALLFPIIVLPAIFMAMGASWFLSALGVFFRDIQQAVGPITLIIMYSSAIFYKTSMVKEKAPEIWNILKFNPLIHVIEQSRNAIILHAPVEWSGIFYAYCFAILVLLLGFASFEKLKPAYADVL